MPDLAHQVKIANDDLREGSMRRYIVGLVALAVLALGVGGEASGVATRSSAVRCESPTAQPPNVGAGHNELSGVAAISGCKAWAVGQYDESRAHHKTLIEYWNGSAWTIQKSPSPGRTSSNLGTVAVTSATNAWAVGSASYFGHSPGEDIVRSLIEHWNGKVWKVQKSPDFGPLYDVAATSPTNAWVLGSYWHDGNHPVIEHWNGRAWKAQRSPNPGSTSLLVAVAAVSRTNAWAVGTVGYPPRPLIEHWNGKSWKIQPSPSPPRRRSTLVAVAATSATSAWAVGNEPPTQNSPGQELILHWNGRRWKIQKSPSFGGLRGVAATSPTNAWAVGYDHHDRALIERWNGTSWTREPTSLGGISMGRNRLIGVAATSATNAWAVDSYVNQAKSLVLHWNGTSWRP